jgi:predicted amidohydrolase
MMVRQNFKVAAFTIDVEGSRETHLETASQLIDEAVQEWSVKMVVFPELFLTGVPDRSTTKQDLMRIAEPIPGPTSTTLAEKAKQHGIYVVAGSIVELAKDDVLHDTCCFIGPDGELVGGISAANLALNTAIKHYTGSGISLAPEENGPRVFDTSLAKVGIMVGEDRSSGKAREKLKAGKPDVVINVANVSARVTAGVVRELSEKYASDFLCYAVFSNVNGLRKNVKDLGDMWYDGNSAIINLGGSVIAQTTVSTFRAFESMAVGMIDLKLLDKVRENSRNREAVAIPW